MYKIDAYLWTGFNQDEIIERIQNDSFIMKRNRSFGLFSVGEFQTLLLVDQTHGRVIMDRLSELEKPDKLNKDNFIFYSELKPLLGGEYFKNCLVLLE